MPQIKEYTQRVGGAAELPLAQVTRQAYASDFNGAGVGAQIAGNALQQAAADAGAIQRMVEDQKARKEVTDAAVELARFNSSAAHELKNAEKNGELNDDAFTEAYMARINTNLDLVGSRFETTAGRQAWERGSAEMSGHYLIAAGEAQSRAAGIRAISQYKDFVDATRNTVMNDPFQFERMEQGAANVINDPKGIFAHIPSDKRDELARTTKTELAKSAVQGVIRLDPRIAMQQLTGDKWDPYLDADNKHALMTEARVGIAGLDAEARRQAAEAARQRKREIDQTNQKMVELYSSKSLTIPQVLDSNLDAVGEGSKEHWVKMIEAQNKEHRSAPIKKDPRLFVNTLEGIRNGTIRSETQIENLFAQSADRGVGITWEDTKQLRQELVELRTPEGAKLSKQLDDFFASRKAQIDKSNPQMGKIDQTGSAKMYDFMTMVRDRVDEYKRQGKDPRVLLDPKSPEFLGSPETLAPYQTTIQESIRTLSESLKRGRTEKPPDENASKKGFFNWFKSDPKPETQSNTPGLLTPGNIDLSKRKVVENADGSFSTVISASFEIEGKVVLLPTLDPNGKQMTNDETVARYEQTGEHLGIFKTEADATAAAKKISKGQESLNPKKGARGAPQSSPVPKESTDQMRGAIADLEKAVRTMPGKDPVIVGPRKAGESAADYLKRWNEAHKND